MQVSEWHLSDSFGIIVSLKSKGLPWASLPICKDRAIEPINRAINQFLGRQKNVIIGGILFENVSKSEVFFILSASRNSDNVF